jgi:hypothetical protein
MAGMMELTNALVIVEERPVIFNCVGILKRDV